MTKNRINIRKVYYQNTPAGMALRIVLNLLFGCMDKLTSSAPWLSIKRIILFALAKIRIGVMRQAPPDVIDVLIVGTPYLRQCYEYRIRHKIQQLTKLSAQSEFVEYMNTQEAMRKILAAKKVIFYRVPWSTEIERMYELCSKLKIEYFWEVDDLVYDPAHYATLPYLSECLPSQAKHLLAESAAFFEAFRKAPAWISSTYPLATTMQCYDNRPGHIIDNAVSDELVALSTEMLPALRKLRENKERPKEIPRTISVGYGSGSLAHDHDFKIVSEAICQTLKAFSHVELVILGDLNLPESLKSFESQIIRVPKLTPHEYYLAIAHLDISLAPLPDSLFNRAKSNIKFLESGIFETVCLCSPTPPYLEIARNGINSFTCATTEEWYSALELLITTPQMRLTLGAQARRDILENYSSSSQRIMRQLDFLIEK